MKFVPLLELDLEEDEKDLPYKPNRKEKFSDLPKKNYQIRDKESESEF
jgi:hypothetical protein